MAGAGACDMNYEGVDIMDKNIIYNEDCIKGMEKIQTGIIDLILCDLPYGIIESGWDNELPITELWKQYNRIIKENGAVILTATQKFAAKLIEANKKYFRYDLVWKKNIPTGHANCNKMPLRQHELILVFYKKAPTFNPQGLIPIPPKPKQRYKNGKFPVDSCYKEKTLSKPYIQKFSNYPKSVLEFSHDSIRVHPTQKPIALFEYLIKTYTNEGELVLDNCMGSGTTAEACINTGRDYIGFETDVYYWEVCQRRITRRLCKKDRIDLHCLECICGAEDNGKVYCVVK